MAGEEKKYSSKKSEKAKVAVEHTNLHAKPLLTWDAYFEILKRENPKIREHHKKALFDFVSRKSSFNNTKEEFDKIVALY